MNSTDFFKNMLTDIKVDLTDEFDRNFERKAFFSKTWQPKAPNGLIGKGKLRRSIRAKIVGKSIIFTSTEDYAAIHNEGGEITVTEKMKRFFWAKAYEAGGKTRTKSGKKGTGKSADKWSKQAEIFKGLALKKVGSKIKIPQRQFIGNAPEVEASIKRIADLHINELLKTIFKK